MRSRLAAVCMAAFTLLQNGTGGARFKTAVPGYAYEFPRDHFSHPDFQTEWWYYTGNLTASDGHRFGFELTFFREGVARATAAQDSVWDLRDAYLAHLALSDLDGESFYHAERTNRAGPGVAGADRARERIWNGNWNVRWHGEDQELKAMDDRFSFSLELHPEKPPVIHGENGVSQKAEGEGRASHYISLTRLKTTGTITLGGKVFQVSGLSWMDHEFFTEQLAVEQVGWDWFSLQMDDNTELMLFRLRHVDGAIDRFSAGTYVDAQGKTRHLGVGDFHVEPLGEVWERPGSAVRYPVRWKIAVPSLGILLEASTRLKSQELLSDAAYSPSYWEGAIQLRGTRHDRPLSGVGYLEMTGYDHPVNF